MRGWIVMLLAAVASGELAITTGRGQKFDGNAQDFRAVSRDGHRILASGSRKEACAKYQALGCRYPVLAVYRTADGRKAFELDGPEGAYFYGGAFTDDGVVTAATGTQSLRWDPATAKTEWTPGGAGPVPPASFGAAETPDGTLGAVAQYRADRTAGLELFTLPGRGELRRLVLRFSELERPRTSMMPQFGKAIALSPDQRWVAIGYGVQYGDTWGDVKAFVGVYALADGHRGAVISGQTYRRNVLLEALTGGDGGPTLGVPLGDRIAFSPDSKTLYGTSGRLFAVDLSRLR